MVKITAVPHHLHLQKTPILFLFCIFLHKICSQSKKSLILNVRHNFIKMNLGLKIKKLRELRNYTQEYVADRIGLDQSAYSRLEKGDTKITFDRLTKIAEVLEVEPEDIDAFDEKQIFNITTQNGHNGYIINVISENERKLYEDQISTLKEEISHLKGMLDKMLGK